MDNVTAMSDFLNSPARKDQLREKGDDLEQAVAMYLRALASNDTDRIAVRLNELKYARNAYAAFRRGRGA